MYHTYIHAHTYTHIHTLSHRVTHTHTHTHVHTQTCTQVPLQIYDRSTFIFLTAFALDVLNMVSEWHTTKIDFVLYPAFIKGMASTTNLIARFGVPVVAFSTTGRL